MIRVANVLYDDGKEMEVKEDMKAYLKRVLGLDWDKSVWDGTVTVPGIEQDKDLLSALRKYVSSERISLDPVERMTHSIGSSSLEMVKAKNGRLPEPVDAVIYPLDREAEDLVLGFSDVSTHFVIFGGGTSVTGGIRGKVDGRTVAIDTSNMKDFQINENIVTAGSGLTGKEIEEKLNSGGRTLGFFPESIYRSTVGGWIATKATGQESNQYGDIEDILLGARIARSDGVLKDAEKPRYSAGIMAKDIVTGSEGRNGLILSATMETHPLPKNRYFSTHMFQSFQAAVRMISRLREFPSVLRVMDETETEISLLELNQRTRALVRRYLGLRGVVNGSLALIVNNDKPFGRYLPDSVWLGSSGAKKWLDTRFERPRLANALWKRGIVVDTLETSCPWGDVEKLHTAVTSSFYRTMRDLDSTGIIMAHLSHQYHAGTCIYFSFLFKSGKEEETLSAVRESIENSMLSSGGTITHHHGLGSYLERYLSPDMKKAQRIFRDLMFSPDIEES